MKGRTRQDISRAEKVGTLEQENEVDALSCNNTMPFMNLSLHIKMRIMPTRRAENSLSGINIHVSWLAEHVIEFHVSPCVSTAGQPNSHNSITW